MADISKITLPNNGGTYDIKDANAIHSESIGAGLTLSEGGVVSADRQVPSVDSSDEGKVLRVVNGTWSAVQLPSASGVSF